MNHLWLFVAPLLLLAVSAETEAGPYYKDPAMQAELDRLIGNALNRNTNANPTRQEYERYYKVRKFVMDFPPSATYADLIAAKSTTTTPAPEEEPADPPYLKTGWWQRHYSKDFVLTDQERARLMDIHRNRGNLRAFPRVKFFNSE
jgi:hypothetical protein